MLVRLYRSSRCARWALDACFVLGVTALLGLLHAAPSARLLLETDFLESL
ncbi:MAG: hypothetical protein R3F62_06035 [Planctomycetota bacterium]